MLATEGTSHVLFGHGELCGQWSSGWSRRRHTYEGEAQARTAFRGAARALRYSSAHGRIRLAGIGWHSFARGGTRHGSSIHALCAGASPFIAAVERDAVRAERDEPATHAAVRHTRRGNHALHFVGADCVSFAAIHPGKQYRVHQSGDQQYSGRTVLCDCDLRFAVFFEDQDDGNFRRGKPGDPAGCDGGETVRVYLAVVRVCSGCQRDHPRLFLEKPRGAAFRLRAGLARQSIAAEMFRAALLFTLRARPRLQSELPLPSAWKRTPNGWRPRFRPCGCWRAWHTSVQDRD